MSGNARPMGRALILAAAVGFVGWAVSPPAAATTTPPVIGAVVPVSPQPISTPTTPKPKPAWTAPLTGTLVVNGDCKVGGEGGHWKAHRNGHLHQGVDLYRPLGTPILAIHSGTVVANHYSISYYAANGRPIGAGWLVRISHGGGIWTTSMHMAGRSPLKVGQKVSAGQQIGRVGHSGTGSDHLHFQVHEGGSANGYTINPSPFLRAHGIPVKGC